MSKWLSCRQGAPFCTPVTWSFRQWTGKVLLSYFSTMSSCDHWAQPKSCQSGKWPEQVYLGTGAFVTCPICSAWWHQAPSCASSCPASCHSRQILVCTKFWASLWGSPSQKLWFSLVYAWSWCNLWISQDASKDGIDANKGPLGILSTQWDTHWLSAPISQGLQ